MEDGRVVPDQNASKSTPVVVADAGWKLAGYGGAQKCGESADPTEVRISSHLPHCPMFRADAACVHFAGAASHRARFPPVEAAQSLADDLVQAAIYFAYRCIRRFLSEKQKRKNERKRSKIECEQ